MSVKKYLNFDLLIEKSGNQYRARVLNSPTGEASLLFSAPFSDLELENFILRLGQAQRRMRRLESPEMENAKQFGRHLFRTVFADDVSACLQSSIDEAARRNAGLRLRLRLADAPELMDLPWEYLYDANSNRFLSLSVDTPLVRYLDLAGRINPLLVKPPLRVLAVISSPTDFLQLDVEQEWRKLQEAVGDLEARGLLKLDRLDKATLAQLQRQLRRCEYHVFHFIGHGAFDEQAHDGILLMEDEQGRGKSVSGQTLGMLLHDEKSLRLALLNACEGGRTSRSDPFAGVGQSLLQQGIPAVIAMQFEVTDDTAITMAHAFYAALADGYPVDAALTEARKSIFVKNDIEWGTPVLYMRSPDGHIFDVDQAALAAAPPAAPAPLLSAAPPGSSQPAAPPKPRRRGLWIGVALLALVLVGIVGVYSILSSGSWGTFIEPQSNGDADSSAEAAPAAQPTVAAATDTPTTAPPSATATTVAVAPPAGENGSESKPSAGQPPGCAAVSEPPIRIGDIAKVCTSRDTVHVRSGPGSEYPTAVALSPGEKFEVIDGPTCGNYKGQQFNWWQVRVNGSEKWIVDGKDTTDEKFICRVENLQPAFGPAVFCADADANGQGYCPHPGISLPSGITKFWINWPFENLPVNTRVDRRWFFNDTPLPAITRERVIWGENETRTHGVGITSVVDGLGLPDGNYRVELYLSGERTPIATATARIGGNNSQVNLPDFSGVWETNFAQMTLQQSGNSVSGTYRLYGGDETISLEGTVVGQTLSGNYRNDSNRAFSFTMLADGNTFNGYWQHPQTHRRYLWCGARNQALPDGCGFSGYWNTEVSGVNAWIELTQTGNRVQGRYSNSAEIGTISGQVGVPGRGDAPHYSVYGDYDITIGGAPFEGNFRFDLVDFGSNQFQGCFESLTTGNHQAWCGWREGQTAPLRCEPVSCP